MATSSGGGGSGGGGGSYSNNNAADSGLVTAYPAEVLVSPTSYLAANSTFRSAILNNDNSISNELLVVPQWKRELIQRRRQNKQQQQQQQNSAAAADPVRSSTTSSTTTTTTAAAGITRGGADSTAAAAADSAPQQLITSSTDESDAAMRLDAAVSGELHQARMINNKQDDCESDSSEELQYGPGIVHKLRSRFLNMTLREMNKNRSSVQCFRRAASLEDLLDHKDDSPDKNRRYAKKNVTGAAAKVERYRNAARGNESMKRARSVEALMRYNSAPAGEIETSNQNHTNRFVANAFKQENDHIILVDRTTVKIENRLLDKDRLKPPVNKPKRIKPVLAETERPPPDLVKTTLRIFESSSVKKLKPKGDVAVKVATFKTINETFKAQNQKKIIPKPPLQPKPFTNGNSRLTASPRKIIVTRKPTAELIEQQQNNQEAHHNDNVITEPIVQSVSSVVSKFQQIEKSCSPASSPEPTFNKIKFSPVPSPEPLTSKTKVSSLDLKSPTITPIPSPRTTPPKVQSPLSPRPVELGKPPSGYLHKPVINNSTPIVASNKSFEQSSKNCVSPLDMLPKLDFEKEKDRDEPAEEQVKETTLEISNQNLDVSELSKTNDTTSSSSEASTLLVESFEEVPEVVDSPKTVTKSAMDNISKAGMTVQYSFSESPSIKNYLPRTPSNPQQETEEDEDEGSLEYDEPEGDESQPNFADNQSAAAANADLIESESPKVDKLLVESYDEIIYKEDPQVCINNQPLEKLPPMGAISSLSLIKSTTCTTSYSQGNESKTIRSQKSESNSSTSSNPSPSSASSSSPPQKQIGIIRPLVSTKTQLPQQNLSNREIEKNLINRVKSIEQQPQKVVVSLKSSADEIQSAVKKSNNSTSPSAGAGGNGAGGGGGLWDAKPAWNQQNNTMVFNFSNRKDVPDYIENDGLIIKRKRDKPRQQSSDNNGSNIDNVQLTDDSDSEYSVGPPSPCDVAFFNDNVLINGRSNLSRTPRNHKCRIQFDDTATRTFEYPSEASMLLHEAAMQAAAQQQQHQQQQQQSVIATTEGTGLASVDGSNEASASGEVAGAAAAATAAARGSSGTLPSLLGGGGLASYTPSKVDLASDGFELGVTRATMTTLASPQTITSPQQQEQTPSDEVDYLKPSQDPQTWGQETAADMLY